MDLRNNKLLRVASVAMLLVGTLMLCSSNVSAEEADGENTGCFGVYEGDMKTGWQDWSYDAEKTVLTYRDLYENGDEVSSYLTINFAKNFSMNKSSGVIVQNGRVFRMEQSYENGNLKSKFAANGREIEKDLEVPEDYMCESFAALVFTWRKSATDKPASFNIVKGFEELKEYVLTPTKKKIKLNGKEVDIVEWVDENEEILIQIDADNKLLKYVSPSDDGGITSCIVESHKVAHSRYTLDEYNAKADEETIVAGDYEGVFSHSLTPVDADADESDGGEYLKVNKMLSFRAVDDWEIAKGGQSRKHVINDCQVETWKVTCEGKASFMIVGFSEMPMDKKRFDPMHPLAFSFAQRAAYTSISSAEHNYLDYRSYRAKSDRWKVMQFPDNTWFYFSKTLITLDQTDEIERYRVLMQNEKHNVFAVGYQRDGEDVEEEFYDMLGSLRTQMEVNNEK